MSLVLAAGMYAVSRTGIIHILYKQLCELRSRKLADDEQSFSLSKEEVSAIRSTNFCKNVTVSYANSGGLMIVKVCDMHVTRLGTSAAFPYLEILTGLRVQTIRRKWQGLPVSH